LDGKLVRDIPVQMLDSLPEFLKHTKVDIAALTLPKENAETTAQQLSKLGIHAIWNFAHVDLDDVEGMVVENVHLSDSLMQLSYNIANNHQ
jgi:redox-sensing transcriptional repressor